MKMYSNLFVSTTVIFALFIVDQKSRTIYNAAFPTINNELACNEQEVLQPEPRHLEKAVYDSRRNRFILFGGIELVKDGFIEPDYLAEWDGIQWKRFDAIGPLGRRGHAMVYDKSSAQTLLFGGVTQIKNKNDSLLFDAWAWNGISWKKIPTTCPLKIPVASYDPVRNRLLVYGDASDKTREVEGEERIFELWEYKKSKWKKLSVEGPKPEGPYEMVFNTNENSIVLPDWKEDKLILWEWKDGRWSNIEYQGDYPPARNRFGLAYHDEEKAIYLFGGRTLVERNSMNDFWKWDGKRWLKIETSEVQPSGKAAMCLEYSGNRLILYGGVENGKLTNDLWEWDGKKWKELNNR